MSLVWLIPVAMGFLARALADQCNGQTFETTQYECLTLNGQQALCPVGAPCACPTPGAQAVGGASFGCYSPLSYHCTQDDPQNGLVLGPGASNAGVCPQLMCNGQQYTLGQHYCLTLDGAQALCPSTASCACPTPGAAAVGGAAYGCYDSSQYHCTTSNPQNGLVSGPGSSNAGVCASPSSFASGPPPTPPTPAATPPASAPPPAPTPSSGINSPPPPPPVNSTQTNDTVSPPLPPPVNNTQTNDTVSPPPPPPVNSIGNSTVKPPPPPPVNTTGNSTIEPPPPPPSLVTFNFTLRLTEYSMETFQASEQADFDQYVMGLAPGIVDVTI